MQVLIVDDDDDTREVLGMILQADGHRVEGASDGLDALAKLHGGSRPSVILVDMMMPRLDGEGFLRAVQQDRRFAHIPVWLVSGHHSVREKAAELGAAGYLVKPVQLDQVLGVVRGVGTESAAYL